MGYAKHFAFVTVKKALFFDYKRISLMNSGFLKEKKANTFKNNLNKYIFDVWLAQKRVYVRKHEAKAYRAEGR